MAIDKNRIARRSLIYNYCQVLTMERLLPRGNRPQQKKSLAKAKHKLTSSHAHDTHKIHTDPSQ